MTRKLGTIVPAIAAAALAMAAAAARADQTLTLDGKAPGKVFEGVGAVSGGGATSVLLKDYPEPQRSEVLDYLFKPQFGAAMQTLYVEIGGDGNSTQGTEPTHMRTRTDVNYDRGYEWWLMAQAKKCNPALTLDACAWSAPGWIGDAGNRNGQFWSQDMCDYYVKWVQGLKSHYGLDLDAIGCRNEKGENINWVKMFRKTLNDAGLNKVRIHAFDSAGNARMWNWITQMTTDKDLAAAVDIIGNHCLNVAPPSPDMRATMESLGKPIWNTEDHIYNSDGRNFRDDYAAALGAVHYFNANYIECGATKMVNWYLVGSTYPIEPYYQQPPAMFASTPWSGHYQLKPILWSYAHYGQFTKIGWHYLPAGCTTLTGGGTIVALKSDDGDYSVIAETTGATANQKVNLKPAGLSTGALCVWRTTREAQFEKQANLAPAADGTFTITMEPNAIYSLSTTRGQQKGAFPDVPANAAFPLPYLDTFDGYADARQFGYLPHYTSDIVGVFEIADRPDNQGKCLRQVVDHKAQSWAPEWRPYTILGDQNWTDYEVSADIFFDNGGWAGVMGRVSGTGTGYGTNPTGYYARLNADGTCGIYVASPALTAGRGRGAATAPATGPATAPRDELAAASVANWKSAGWHNVKLRMEGAKLTLLVDNVEVAAADTQSVAQNLRQSRGLAGLITGGDGNNRNSALFDNLLINKVNGTAVRPTVFAADAHPIYAK